jgi:hypothetical protein
MKPREMIRRRIDEDVSLVVFIVVVGVFFRYILPFFVWLAEWIEKTKEDLPPMIDDDNGDNNRHRGSGDDDGDDDGGGLF